MIKKKMLAILATSIIAMGLVSGCSSNSDDKGSENASSSEKKVIKIATQTPLSGGSATLGEAIKLGAQLALEENKQKFADLGFTLQLVPYDDQGDPKKGVANAQLIGADKDILAVVGHLNSGVAIPSSEKYEQYHIAMVSPSNTAVDVTERGLKCVNRICGRDDNQGPAGADFAVNDLKAKKIFVIQDKTAYGTGLAEAYKKSAEESGAEIVGYEGITVGEKDFNGVLNQVLAKKPDVVFFGGLYSEGGLLIKQAREKGIKIPFMGGDGLDSSTLVEIAGDAVINTFITSVAAETDATESGKEFIKNYEAKFNKKVESYSVYGYDCMGTILHALEDLVKKDNAKVPTREQVEAAVRAVKDYKGAVTDVSFDDKGDNVNAKIYIYSFEKAEYPPVMKGEVAK